MARKEKHFVDGIEVPTVTQVLDLVGDKIGLQLWYGKHGIAECQRVKRESAEFGTKVHGLVESSLRGLPVTIDNDRAGDCARLILQWVQETKLQPLHIEPELSSREYLYVGHPDVIGRFGENGPLFVLDWKTSNHIDDNYALQIAAYAQAHYEMTGEKVERGGIVRVSKDPTKAKQFEVKEYTDLFGKYVPLFLSARKLYDFYRRKGDWKRVA